MYVTRRCCGGGGVIIARRHKRRRSRVQIDFSPLSGAINWSSCTNEGKAALRARMLRELDSSVVCDAPRRPHGEQIASLLQRRGTYALGFLRSLFLPEQRCWRPIRSLSFRRGGGVALEIQMWIGTSRLEVARR